MSWYAINMDISLRFPKWTSITGDIIDCQDERKHDIRQWIFSASHRPRIVMFCMLPFSLVECLVNIFIYLYHSWRNCPLLTVTEVTWLKLQKSLMRTSFINNKHLMCIETLRIIKDLSIGQGRLIATVVL